MALADLSTQELAALTQSLRSSYDELASRGLKLDLTRGKPSAAQLDLSNELLSLPKGFTAKDGTDTRNYGGLDGLLELREIFAELLWVDPNQLLAQGNSSLSLMQQVLVDCLLHGAVDSERPWAAEEKIRFVCPVPGYDRHFSLLHSFGIEMIPVPMRADGPDADAIAALVKDDPSIKGMWVVPTYANPTGDTVTQEVAVRLVSMPTAAPDFKIFWDNAYALHHLTEEETKTADVLSLASASGNPNRPIMFASTSKITFAGAGVAFLAASTDNIAWFKKHLSMASIGPDKINQLRHAQFFGDAEGVRAHMRKHAQIIAPKFEAVHRILTERLGGQDVAEWTQPIGGYFVSLDVVPGTASRVVELAKEAGIALTPAGSSYPLGQDPDDANIRLAPTMPPLEEVETAMDGVATCVLLAAVEHLAR
ncbi:aminotransferase class I/II-fold pyridoxal phosphate-dependent enzyme [Calidifontibacter sp. DB0510]|uniref:Aminotransferase class I/II-fold pyridoxal phosphate-dependent enzyme n=1 Tax=Metallococcus carri TaxID=1656884 RepID=A0A967AY78_9MICO|nr:aminotransferase class I/II-fold pyridoxal phosphate-dependent enzyme [Metallococcus carri]NHN55191.1 aminotransferase class I/II-fold pyridoxal phosphate-dependent enzyme [Metallococcus carri]NOP36268.1 aminotransferase class I/II-fold pyridoxal phosphate-dependent enzyme [Calidifontibacter sp. DB2511S]